MNQSERFVLQKIARARNEIDQLMKALRAVAHDAILVLAAMDDMEDDLQKQSEREG